MANKLINVSRLQAIAQGQPKVEPQSKPNALTAALESSKRRPIAELVASPSPASQLRHDQIFRGFTNFPVDMIDIYEDNPRKKESQSFASLKASIKEKGIEHPITVTRRPGAERYVTKAGGGRRLKAAKELWAETNDPRFQYVEVIETPYKGELDIYASHVTENDQRENLCFWDSANAYIELKKRTEVARGEKYGHRPTLKILHEHGVVVDYTNLVFSTFAVERLAMLGQAANKLTRNATRRIQPKLNALIALLARQAPRDTKGQSSFDEEAAYTSLFNPVMAKVGQRIGDEPGDFPEDDLLSALHVAVAEHLQVPSEQLHKMLAIAEQFKDLTFSEIVARATMLVVKPQAQPSLLAHESEARDDTFDHQDHLDRRSNPTRRSSDQAGQAESLLREVKGASEASETSYSDQLDYRLLSHLDIETLHHILMTRIDAFAKAHGVNALVMELPDMPLGFAMQLPQPAWSIDDPAEDLTQPSKRFAWWTLAALAKQINIEYVDVLPGLLNKVLQDADDNGAAHSLCSAQTGGSPGSDDVLLCLANHDHVGSQDLHDVLAILRVWKQKQSD